MVNIDIGINKIAGYFRKKALIIIIIFIIGIVLISFLSIKVLFIAQGNLFQEYPELKYSDSICGVLRHVEMNRAAILIELNNKRKVHTKPTNNYLYSPSYLEKFLRTGDSIFKNMNSDTLYVYRGYNKYYFIINKSINQID